MDPTCEEIQRSIPWLLDDELDAEQSLEIEAHLGACAACRAQLERQGQLRLALQRAAASIAVPVSLRNRIHDAMDRERRAQTVWNKAWPAVVAAAILLSFIWKGANGGLASDLDELAMRHARDLPMDVVAPDVGEVQTYLSGKLPFAVRIPALNDEEPLKLLGGRVIQLNDHRDAAYVRYDMAHGRVSMVVYQDGANQEMSEVAPLYTLGNQQVMLKQVRGYTAAKWKAAGLVYSVVTDLPENEFSVVLHQSMR